eukprot:GHVS01025144.1.p1 GENE.GHVS01025144.1~~GHVS01025144.1.p1  ORF type:complete len:298 (+),score=58.22 GHVS01025144.1:206-1099(+)
MSKRPLEQQEQCHEQQAATNNRTSHTPFKRIKFLSGSSNAPTAQHTPVVLPTTTDTHVAPYRYPTTRKRKPSSDSLVLPDSKQLRHIHSSDPLVVPLLPLATTYTSVDPHCYVPECSTTVSPIDESSNNVHPQQRQISTDGPPGVLPSGDSVVVFQSPSYDDYISATTGSSYSTSSSRPLSLPPSTTPQLPCVSSIVPYKHHFDWWMNVLRASDAQKEWLGSNRHLVAKLIEDMLAAGGSGSLSEFPKMSIDTLIRLWREQREQPAETDIVGTDASRIFEVMDDEQDVREEEEMCVE